MDEPDYWKRLARRRLTRRRLLTGYSTAPKNSFNLADPTLDRMLDNQRAEFDIDKRRELVLEIQDYLLENVLARLDWVAPSQPSTRWPYLGNRRMTPWFGDWYLYPPNLWIDAGSSHFRGQAGIGQQPVAGPKGRSSKCRRTATGAG